MAPGGLDEGTRIGGITPFVMTDEEAGAVQRMPNLVGVIPSAREMAATMTPAQIEQLALQRQADEGRRCQHGPGTGAGPRRRARARP